MPSKKLSVLFMLILFAGFAFPQTEIQLLDNNILRELTYEISGVRAKDYITSISQYNRTDGAYENTGYEKAVNFVMDFLNNCGLKDVKLHKYLSDGTKTYGTWRSNPGFRVKSAKLYMVQPQKSKWCDFSRVALSLMPYSNGSGTDEAEVVYVSGGIRERDYEGKDVKGKIVFADRYDPTALMREAVIKRGAVGILVGASGSAVKLDYPTLVELNRLYVTGEETKKSRWGFSLNKKQTDLLKRYLDTGRKVIMRAEVYAETFSGNMPIISASIKGSKYPDQEIIYVAHLDHYKPGANDNASGSAGLMEIASTLTKLINENKIPVPKRTIRFLWVPEQQGTAAYIENNMETVKKGIICINMDMIGENNQLCGSYLRITRTPWSRPSFLDALTTYYTKFVDDMNITTRIGSNDKFNYRIVDYWGESDHALFNDAQVGVPSTMLVHFPDKFWHTSFDTPDKVDPTELERNIFLGTFLGWTTANYDEEDIDEITELTYMDMIKKIETYTVRYLALLKRAGNNNIHQIFRNTKNYMDLLYDNGTESLDYSLKYIPNSDKNTTKENKKLLRKYIDIQKERIENFYKNLCIERNIKTEHVKLSDIEKECLKIVPERLTTQSLGTWTWRDVVRPKRLFEFGYDILWEMLNYTDGKNNLLKIRDAASAQFREFNIERVKQVYEVLKEKNLVKF